MKKKHVLILTAAVAGAVALGAGCGKKVTAESLIDEVTKTHRRKALLKERCYWILKEQFLWSRMARAPVWIWR